MKKNLLWHFNYSGYYSTGAGTSKTLRVFGIFIFLGSIILSIIILNFLMIICGFIVMLLFLSLSILIDLLIDIKYELIYTRIKDNPEPEKKESKENA
ncbi:MAG: hypothetical protein KKB34_10285 [Bacteroidetes bacterium]|nr:hypothetical protein [Bacteroidota bacterium]